MTIGGIMENRGKFSIKAMYHLVFFIGFITSLRVIFTFASFGNLDLEILIFFTVEALITSLYLLILKLLGGFNGVDIDKLKGEILDIKFSKFIPLGLFSVGGQGIGCLLPLLGSGLLGFFTLMVFLFIGLFILKYVVIYILMKIIFNFLISLMDFKPTILLILSLMTFAYSLSVLSDIKVNNLSNQEVQMKKDNLGYAIDLGQKWIADEDDVWYIINDILYKSNLDNSKYENYMDLSDLFESDLLFKEDNKIYFQDNRHFGYIDIDTKTIHIIGEYLASVDSIEGNKIILCSTARNEYGYYEYYLYDFVNNEFLNKSNPVRLNMSNMESRMYVQDDYIYLYLNGNAYKNNTLIYSLENETIRYLHATDEFIAIITDKKIYIISNSDYILKKVVNNEQFVFSKVSKKYFFSNNRVYVFSEHDLNFKIIFTKVYPSGEITKFDFIENHFFYEVDDKLYYSYNDERIEILGYYRTNSDIYLLKKENDQYLINREEIYE